MAPSVVVSSHPYVGLAANTPANEEASLFTENMIYVAFYMGSCFLHTHTHTSQDDSYNCRVVNPLSQEGGGVGKGGLKMIGMGHSRDKGSFPFFAPSPY